MDLDLFSAFDDEGESVTEVPEPTEVEPALTSRKRPLSKDSPVEKSRDIKRGVGVESGAAELKDAPVNLTITHTEVREMKWDGRSVLTFSAIPEGLASAQVADKGIEQTLPENPAKTYPFELDPFQKQSIAYIERNESVLVSAHTSAGKTVVAEYAVARSLRDKQRVIYTSPIKALSNQKFRDMQEEFGVDQVGLMTGDITINPTATCLIMTTEILRSMLYRGSEIMREVAWVIYDEIHYMRDKERGVVWEESIILLPHKVRFVFLSATIPNAREFVGWIAKLHHQACHVVYTDYRPTPLQHYIFPAGGEGLHLVVDDKGKFRDEAFQRAMAKLHNMSDDQAKATGNDKQKKKGGGNQDNKSDVKRIIQLIMERGLDPVIVFSFSKKECEAHAMMTSKIDLNDDNSKELVEQVFSNAIDALSDDDKQLPQIVNLLPILKRGIGIHHGGLLPILKEVIEILFQEGLLKCLFATETFSIGLNMPAHTVVFTQCRKFDGKNFRWITSGEYIQMSGRAGRRGKDDKGIVIQMLDEKMEPAEAKSILYGAPDRLYSSYHVSYNMLLNMVRVEGADPEFLIRSSFHQYQQQEGVPAIEAQAEDLTKERDAMVIEDEAGVADYHNLTTEVAKCKKETCALKMLAENCLPWIQAGRLVYVVDKDQDFGWGAVVDLCKSKDRGAAVLKSNHLVEVLLTCRGDSPQDDPQAYDQSQGGGGGEVRIVRLALHVITELSSVRIYLPKDLTGKESRSAIFKTISEVQRRFKGSIPVLDPVADMGIKGEGMEILLQKQRTLEERQKASPFYNAEDLKSRCAAYGKKADLTERIKLLRKKVKESQALVMKDILRHMKRVLTRLGHTNKDHVIDTKGRVACEVNTADELLVTELMFNGLFNELNNGQIAAVLSCMVFQERQKEDAPEPKLPQDLMDAFRKLQETARANAKVMVEAKIDMDVEEYVKAFNPGLMEVVSAWCNGAKFIDICKMTQVYEGSVIRVIRRLEELLRQLASASFVIGNMELKAKFDDASSKMRRDIVFAASLYL